MKIVLISQNASPGLLIFRADLISYLVGLGHQVFAFAIDYTDQTKDKVKALGAVPVDYKLNKTGLNPFSDFFDTWRLSRQLKKIKPDVAFSFIKPSLFGTLAAMLAGVSRRVAMLEGLGYIHTPSKQGFSFKKNILQYIHGLLATFAFFFANAVIFLNQDDPKDLLRKAWINKKKINVLGPIGLNLLDYPHTAIDLSKPLRFIFIARLLAEKGVYEYFDAAYKVKLIYPHVKFVVLGGLDPDNPSALSKAQLESVISENIVIYGGHVSNVKAWIADAHIFVLPSYREGAPRSTQEAMAMGRVVITTDVPGCRETVIDGINGFLVRPYDSQELAQKMIYFIEHPEEIKRMGQESYRIAKERFDVHKINPKLSQLVIGK